MLKRSKFRVQSSRFKVQGSAIRSHLDQSEVCLFFAPATFSFLLRIWRLELWNFGPWTLDFGLYTVAVKVYEHPTFQMACQQFDQVADYLEIPRDERDRIKYPKRS